MKKICLLFILAILTTILSCSRDEIAMVSPVEEIINLPAANISVLKKDGYYYISDDILITEEQFQYLKNFNLNDGKSVITSQLIKTWPNGEVPYTIAPGFSNPSRIAQAITDLTNNTGIKLVARTSQHDYVEFINSIDDSVSRSWLGRKGGKQDIEISRYAGYGTIIHEIGHAVGLGHEHQRPDRNSHLWINPALTSDINYQILDNRIFKMVGDLDYGSIMMYPSSSDMLKLNGTGWSAQRIALSETDRKGLYHHYQPYDYDYNPVEIIEYNVYGGQDIYHVGLSVKVNFFKNKVSHASDLSYNVRVVAQFQETTYAHPNGYITEEYYDMNSIQGGTISWESRTDTYQSYPQPGHHEKYLHKILIKNF